LDAVARKRDEITEIDNKLQQLLLKLEDKKALTRAGAIKSLFKFNDPSTMPHIVRALSDRSSKVRFMAALWLGKTSREEAIKPLIATLSDSDWDVRMTGARSLGDLILKHRKYPPDLVRQLIKRLKDQEGLVRIEATRVLGILLSGKGKCPPQIIKMLKDSDSLVRMEVAETISIIQDRTALPFLWRAIRDRSALVRRYVAGAIGVLGGKVDLKRLQQGLNLERSDKAKIGYYEALYLLGEDSVLTDILKFLDQQDYLLRATAANILCDVVADSSNVDIILPALKRAYKKEASINTKRTLRNCIREIGKLKK
jgi:HEAT repeat protein